MIIHHRAFFAAFVAVSSAIPHASTAQGGRASGEGQGGGRGSWDVTLARGKTREIDFTTNEGTWMSVDLSPDGSWIAFDLLGHVYRMPATGGEATALTQNSGVALNFQPRISPDGRSIAFITDRRGQYNLWIMNADGTNPRPVFSDVNATALEPAWTPDGNYIVVRRGGRGGGEGGAAAGGLWMYHKDGGQGAPLVVVAGRRSRRRRRERSAFVAQRLRRTASICTTRSTMTVEIGPAARRFDPAAPLRVQDRRDRRHHRGREQRRGGRPILDRRRGGARDLTRRPLARVRAPDSRWPARVQGTQVTVRARRSGCAT